MKHMKHTMNITEIPLHNPGFRDAFHIPCIVMEAREELYPGCRVTRDGRDARGTLQQSFGVVSPWHPQQVIEPKQRFWCLVRPDATTDVRHVWYHPEIPSDHDYIPDDDEETPLEEEEHDPGADVDDAYCRMCDH